MAGTVDPAHPFGQVDTVMERRRAAEEPAREG